jgi:hypothetical protein
MLMKSPHPDRLPRIKSGGVSPASPRGGGKTPFRASLSGLLRAGAVFVAAFALWGAANTQSLPARAGVKTVGIISALGNTFMFEDASPSAFDWLRPAKADFLEISDWGVDDLVTQTIAKAVAKHFAVKPVTFEPADFNTWTYDDLAHRIRDFEDPDPDIDAYLVIVRDWRGDAIGASGHRFAGLGLYRRDPGAGKSLLSVFASYRIVILDAHDDHVIASRAALLPDGTLPRVAADASLWPKTQNDLTDAQRAILQSDIRKLIAASLPPTLQRMKLTD